MLNKEEKELIKLVEKSDMQKHNKEATINIIKVNRIFVDKTIEALDLKPNHKDYSKPLEVQYLCSQCHHNLHNPLKEGWTYE